LKTFRPVTYSGDTPIFDTQKNDSYISIKQMGINLKKILRGSLSVLKEGASIVLLVGPRKWKAVAMVIIGLVPRLKKLIPKKKGGSTVNEFESAIRKIIEAVVGLGEKSGLEKALALVPALLAIQEVSSAIQGVSKDEYVPKLKEALDNLIGSEENALIGDGANAIIKVDLKYVSVEKLTDLILDSAEKALLPAA